MNRRTVRSENKIGRLNKLLSFEFSKEKIDMRASTERKKHFYEGQQSTRIANSMHISVKIPAGY